MAENNNSQNNKKPPISSNPRKNGRGFNFYWIYGILAVVFIALQYFGGWSGAPEKITFQKFDNEMFSQNEVDKVMLSTRKVDVYEDKLSQEIRESGKGYSGGLNKITIILLRSVQ